MHIGVECWMQESSSSVPLIPGVHWGVCGNNFKMITCVSKSLEFGHHQTHGNVHEGSVSESNGDAHYASSLINHPDAVTFCNLLIDSPLTSPADAMSALVGVGWELQFHILAESFFKLSFYLEASLCSAQTSVPNIQYIGCFLQVCNP